jgi:hypothetical protein
MGAVRKVESCNTHPSSEELFQDLYAAAHRSKCAHHLSASARFMATTVLPLIADKHLNFLWKNPVAT